MMAKRVTTRPSRENDRLPAARRRSAPRPASAPEPLDVLEEGPAQAVAGGLLALASVSMPLLSAPVSLLETEQLSPADMNAVLKQIISRIDYANAAERHSHADAVELTVHMS